MRGRLVASLAVVAMACVSCGDGSGGGSGNTLRTGFNRPPGFNSTVFSTASAGDGSGNVYVGGDFTSYNGTVVTRLVRLKTDGTVDPAFVTGVGFNGTVRSIAPAGDGTGDLYVGGAFTSYNGTVANNLVRLKANGTVDQAFATGTGFNNTVFSVAPAGDGSGNVYVGGDFTSYNSTPTNELVRLRADGTVDLTFGTGAGFTGVGFHNSSVRSIAPAGDGSGNVYVGGAFTTYNGTVANDLVRLKANGMMDLAFLTGTGFDNTVYSIALVGDGTGDLYVGGAFTSYNGTVVNDLVRLHTNGMVDLTFGTGTGFNNTVFSVALAGDGTGDLYVGGAFTSYNGTVANDLVRLHTNGTVDPVFATGTGFDNTVFSVVPAGDGTGNVYVGGDFTSYQSTTLGRIARLNSKGSAV
ncbi:hypothetical protein [Petrachloros mirabilis]